MESRQELDNSDDRNEDSKPTSKQKSMNKLPEKKRSNLKPQSRPVDSDNISLGYFWSSSVTRFKSMRT